MKEQEKKKKIDIRSVKMFSLILVLIAAALMVVLIFATGNVFQNFNFLRNATEEFIEMQQSTSDLMDGSSYLTDRVRRFVVTGEPSCLEDYFEEVYVTKRRDGALARMEETLAGTEAHRYLEEALANSESLMGREYYAMRLAAEAYGLEASTLPEDVRSVSLSLEDAALDPAQKREAAIDMVFGDEYLVRRAEIVADVDRCSELLDATAREDQQQSMQSLLTSLRRQILAIVAMMISMLAVVNLTRVLVIHPLNNSLEHIRNNEKVPETGSTEMKYFARAYNEMYEQTRKEQESLSYEASHDALTGLCNRKMFDRVREECDPESTAMILVDVDYFKEVNDTYGHEMGDSVLKRVAGVLRAGFRSEDQVCRIGGDEFAVLMMHTDISLKDLVSHKIETALAQLKDEENGVPGVTLSIGIAFPQPGIDAGDLFRNADNALYVVKERGRNGYEFYRKN